MRDHPGTSRCQPAANRAPTPVWQVGAVEVLLQAGANALATDLLGRTPLQVCLTAGSASKHGKDTWGGSTCAHDTKSGAPASSPMSAEFVAAIKALLDTAMGRARACAAEARASGVLPRARVDTEGPGQMEEVLTAEERSQLSNFTEHVRAQLFGKRTAGVGGPADATEGGQEHVADEQEDEDLGEAARFAAQEGDTTKRDELMDEILSEIRGHDDSSLTVSDFTSSGGVDPTLALSFKAAKMVCPLFPVRQEFWIVLCIKRVSCQRWQGVLRTGHTSPA